jgi:16S rRNA (guanine(1405)-N(7))-methyltransferase
VTEHLNFLISEILSARKYRDLDLSSDTVRSLLEQELPRHKSEKDAVHSVRQKLHNVVASYLGDPDYAQAAQSLSDAFATRDAKSVRQACTAILDAHQSTHERMAILDGFYPALWQITGLPHTIFDLACGLNPFAFLWMGLPTTVQYHAYDIVGPRVNLVNHFFGLMDRDPLAEVRDILVAPPEGEADVAIFFKEAHRFEQPGILAVAQGEMAAGLTAN